jgi:membrane protein YqaA with SNARE-associated domain
MGWVEALEELLQSQFFADFGLLGLFLNGILSSITPFPTEITVSALILSGQNKEAIFVTLAVASVAGGFLGYYIGYGGNKFLHKIKRVGSDGKGHRIFARYGWLAIFLSAWIPMIGDIIPVVAGAKKYELKKFAVAISAGKLVKVAAIVYLGGILLPYLIELGRLGG